MSTGQRQPQQTTRPAATKPQTQAAKPDLSAALNETPLNDFEQLLRGRQVEFTPSGRETPIKLSVEIFRRFFVRKTKQGASPSDEQITQAVMTCQARKLDPWLNEVYLVGYDTKDGPEFNIITSVHALHKRAEQRDEYDGLEAGVVVLDPDGQIHNLDGEVYPDKWTLIGGWCRVFRKDKTHNFFRSVRLAAYDKGRSVWNSDKSGMIRKCAVAAALREAFPNQCGGLYTSDELPAMMAAATKRMAPEWDQSALSSQLADIKSELARMMDKPVTQKAAEHDDGPQYINDVSTEAGQAVSGMDEAFDESAAWACIERATDAQELEFELSQVPGTESEKMRLRQRWQEARQKAASAKGKK